MRTKTLAAAVDGEDISVGPGAYSENIVVNKAVSLLGAGSGVTTLSSANGASEFLILLGANVPITLAQGIEISGFTFKGPLNGDEDLIMFRARVNDANDPIVIRDNVFDCELDHSLKGIESRSGGDITNVVIESNQFINECRYPMFLNSAINWLIQDNTVTSSWTGGFLMNTSTVDQLHDIDVLNNSFDQTCSRPDAGGFLPNQYVTAIGLASTAYNVLVSGNTITNSDGHAITMGDRTNVDMSNVNILCNDMQNNAGGTLNEVPANVLPAENNYWGAADGPGPVGPGSGDPITTGYDFTPFLAAPPGPNCPPPVPTTTPVGLIALGVGLVGMLFLAVVKKIRADGATIG